MKREFHYLISGGYRVTRYANDDTAAVALGNEKQTETYGMWSNLTDFETFVSDLATVAADWRDAYERQERENRVYCSCGEVVSDDGGECSACGGRQFS